MKRSLQLVSVVVGSTLTAQTIDWQRSDPIGSGSRTTSLDAFADFDNDGCQDAIAAYIANCQVNCLSEVRVVSGRDGSWIWPPSGASPIYGAIVHHAGDMDGDGSPDFASIIATQTGPLVRILEIWSPARNTLLWSTTGSAAGNFGGFGGQTSGMIGDIDVNGDGRPDLVAATINSNTESDVFVYDNSGALRYRLPALALGWIVQSLAKMPDLDGDGGEDFLVGALQPGIGGGVFVVSGRTGAILRLSTDLRPGDVLGGAVTDAGDVDGDGVHDYATASYRFSPLTQIAIFSGATGALIRNWDDYWTNDSGLVGDVDVDLDGVPDLLVGNGGITLRGEIRAYSGRDGSVLWTLSGVLPG